MDLVKLATSMGPEGRIILYGGCQLLEEESIALAPKRFDTLLCPESPLNHGLQSTPQTRLPRNSDPQNSACAPHKREPGESPLALDEPNHLRDRIFRRYQDYHVHMVGPKMAFFNPALLLRG